MVQEAGEFASEDEAQRKRIEALNALSSFVYGLKGQLSDQEGLGARKSKMPMARYGRLVLLIPLNKRYAESRIRLCDV